MKKIIALIVFVIVATSATSGFAQFKAFQLLRKEQQKVVDPVSTNSIVTTPVVTDITEVPKVPQQIQSFVWNESSVTIQPGNAVRLGGIVTLSNGRKITGVEMLQYGTFVISGSQPSTYHYKVAQDGVWVLGDTPGMFQIVFVSSDETWIGVQATVNARYVVQNTAMTQIETTASVLAGGQIVQGFLRFNAGVNGTLVIQTQGWIADKNILNVSISKVGAKIGERVEIFRFQLPEGTLGNNLDINYQVYHVTGNNWTQIDNGHANVGLKSGGREQIKNCSVDTFKEITIDLGYNWYDANPQIVGEISIGNFFLTFVPSIRYSWDGTIQVVMTESAWNQEIMLPAGLYNVALSIQTGELTERKTTKLFSSECLATDDQMFNPVFTVG